MINNLFCQILLQYFQEHVSVKKLCDPFLACLDLPPCVSEISTGLDPPSPLICCCNTWTGGELLDDLYNTFQIIKICFLVRASAWLNTWSCPPVCLSACLWSLACLESSKRYGNSQQHCIAHLIQQYGRQPLMEDDLWWRTTYDGRWPLMEDDI